MNTSTEDIIIIDIVFLKNLPPIVKGKKIRCTINIIQKYISKTFFVFRIKKGMKLNITLEAIKIRPLSKSEFLNLTNEFTNINNEIKINIITNNMSII